MNYNTYYYAKNETFEYLNSFLKIQYTKLVISFYQFIDFGLSLTFISTSISSIHMCRHLEHNCSFFLFFLPHIVLVL